MIDLSFLTEAEQEAILRVLNRDAELKKAEEERVRHLYDAVDDENELKYKSGQWFYEAKSKRHRDKIHGADLVRASMRKRKAPPATLAELSRNYKENSKKSWVSSVNKDVFIPPELYGVMEDQEEEQGGFVPVKIEPTQSSKRVSFLSTDKNMESSKNGNVSPSRQRRNPFNSTNEGDDDTELGKDTHEPVNGPESGDKVSYPDVLPPKIKFGVKLPYPAPGEIIRLSSTSPNASLTNGGQIPIPKPRTMPLKKTDSLERSSSDLKREDSFGSSGRPKSILKRRSSSSSTDSESIRLAQKADLNKIGLSTPILQAEPVDESPDKLKQVRFSANVHQNPPSPGGESVGGKEIGEFGILEPGLSQASLENRASSEDSVSAPKPSSSLVLDILTKTIYRKGSGEIPDLNGSPVEGPSLGANSASLNEDLNNIKEDSFVQENKPEVSLALEANVSSDKKPESESPDASKRNSIDPKQGKPPVVGIPGNPDPLNPDKHTIEIMKAQDESISKVLDWLNRSSESGDDEPNMSENKPVNSEKPVPIYTDKCGEGNNVPQEMLVSGNTMPALLQQKPPSYIQPVSDVISPPSNEVDRAGVEGNVELTTFENLEDLQQATDSFQNSMGPTAEPLVFGTSKGGIGKIHNHVHFAEDMENQQKEDALSPARLPSPVQNDFLPIDENGVQETLVPENLESILIQGQAEANTQSEFLHENSIGVLENVESPSHINTNLPEASTDFGVPKQSSEVGEPLVFGYSRGGIGKMRNPVVNELGNVAIDNTNNLDSANTKDQVTPIVREEETKIPENFLTQGSDPILQEQPIVEGLSGSSPYQSETENNYDEPGVETNADFWTQAAIKYVPGTINEVTEGSLNLGEGKHSTIEFGEKETAELPQNAENMDSEDTDNQADEVTLANPQSLGQCESNQESGTKISDFEPKSINEVKQFWEKGEKERNTQSEMKKSTQKDVAALGSQIHVKESIAAFSQKSSSFESDDGNSGLVTFKKVILDEESLPSIAQLKTFWEQERNKLENLECRPKNELIENGTGQCEVRPTFATPPLNFDRMEKRKKNRKRHTFHCFFEGDQDSVSKQDYLTRGVSLHDGALGVDKKYNSSTFQSLRSFWDAGKNIQDDPMLPAVEKNLEPPTIQAATTTNLQNGPDTTFQEKGRQISNLSDEELSLSDSNNTVKSETEINMENPNIQTSSSQEPVSETVVKTVAPSKAATELQKEITDADLDFGSEVKPICDSTSQNTMIDHLPLESKETEMRDQDTPENPDQDRFEHSQSNVVEESDTICNMPTSEIFTSTEEPVEEGLNSPISFPNSDLYSYHTRPQEQSNEYPKTNTLELIPNNITGYDENRTSILETDLMANNTSLKEDTSYQTESSTAASDESAYATQEEFLSSSERVPPDGRSFDNELENSSNALEKLNERDLPEEVYEGLEKTSLERNNDLETNLEKLARESVPPAEGQQFPSSDPEIVSSDSSQPPMSLIFNDSVQGNLAMPEKQSKKEIIEKIKNPDIRSRPFYTNFDTGLAKLYRESLDLDPSGLEASDQNPVSVENNMEVQNPNEFVHMSLSAQSSAFINDPELHDSDHATPEESISSDSMYSDALSEVVDSVKRTAVQRRELFANDFQISQEVVSDAEDLMGGSQSKVFIQTASIKLQMNRYNRNMSEQGVSADSSSTEGETPTQDSSVPQDDHREVGERRELVEDDDPADPLLQHVTQSTPLKERNSSLRRSTLQLYLEAPYRRDLSKSIDFELTGYLAPEAGHQK
uniref:Synaptotagmin like 2 n=1 Tax=Xenopus tropicalis TaxID=8364 RepID=A0A6I8RX63_XENTR